MNNTEKKLFIRKNANKNYRLFLFDVLGQSLIKTNKIIIENK